MTMLCTEKARAIHASPGFFNFVPFLALALILGVDTSPAQHPGIVRDIIVIGNGTVSSSMIFEWMETKRGGAYRSSDLARIDSGLADAGFPFGRVDSIGFRQAPDSLSSDLVLYIREGKPGRIAEVQLEGARVLGAASVLSKHGLSIGDPFTPRSIEQGISAVLKEYEAVGYPFARVEIRDIRFQEDPTFVQTRVSLSIDEGTVARLSELRVEGNTSTRSAVIIRAAGFSPGDPITAGLPSKIKQRLEKLQLFSSVSTPELFVNSDRSVGLIVRVVEGNPNRFDGIVGYVPQGSSGGSGYVTGFADVQFRNIAGTGRKLSARWNRESKTSQEIALRYREPWIASLPIFAEGGYGQRKQDSTYVRESYDLALETVVGENLTAGLVAAGNRVTPTEGFGQMVVGQSSSLSVGVSLAYDSRNDHVTPTAGFRYRAEYQTGRKEILTPVRGNARVKTSTQMLTSDVDYYASLLSNQVLAVLVSARDFRSSAIEFGELFRLGGATTLRGYREGQFLGSRIAWANLEYRLLTGQRSFVFGFVDLGYASVPGRVEAGLNAAEFRRLGYGAGVRLDTPLGLIGVSLAFGEGDTFSTAKLHLRLVNEF